MQDETDGQTGRQREGERKRAASRTIWPLTGIGPGSKGVGIEMKTGRYPKPCRFFAMVVNEGY